MLNTKTVAASIEFSFEDQVTDKDLKKIAKKVTTVCNNADYQTVVAYFVSHKSIEVIITFLDINHKIFDKMRTPLYRLIDSHKQPATFGWSLDTNAILELVAA